MRRGPSNFSLQFVGVTISVEQVLNYGFLLPSGHYIGQPCSWKIRLQLSVASFQWDYSLWPLHRTTLRLEDSFTIECGIVSVGLRSERWFGLSITDEYSRAVGPGGMSRFEDTSQRATLEDRPKKAALRLESSSGGEHRWHSAEAVWRHALPLDRCKSSSVGQGHGTDCLLLDVRSWPV